MPSMGIADVVSRPNEFRGKVRYKWGYLTLKAFKWQKINGYLIVFYDPT